MNCCIVNGWISNTWTISFIADERICDYCYCITCEVIHINSILLGYLPVTVIHNFIFRLRRSC